MNATKKKTDWTERRRFVLLQIGNCGCHLEHYNVLADGITPNPIYGNCSINGIGPLEMCLEKYGHELAGVTVVDITPNAVECAISGPLLATKPGSEARWKDIAAAASPAFMAGIAMSGFGPTMALGYTDPGSLDTVPLPEYVDWHRRHKARIGKVAADGKSVEWEA